MIIDISNGNGTTAKVTSSTYRDAYQNPNNYILMSYDFGTVPETTNQDSFIGVDGSSYVSSSYGSRDVTFTFLNRGGNVSTIIRALSPKKTATLTFNNTYQAVGKFIGTPSIKELAFNTDKAYSVTFRMFNPYFSATSPVIVDVTDTDLTDGNIATEITLTNVGDVPCSVLGQIKPKTSGTRGLYTNSSKTKGWQFTSAATIDVQKTFNTDRSDKTAFQDYNSFTKYEMYEIPLRTSKLYSQNISGRVIYTPLYIDISEART